jgi:hypothetical protein
VSRVPGRVWVLLFAGIIFAGGFAGVVYPLLQTGGTDVHAEVTGAIPDHATVGQPLQVPVALDNTSGAVISPLCVAAQFDGPVDAREVRFAGLDTVPFHNGRACGGKLSGQETVSAVVVFAPSQAGTLHVSLSVAQGDRIIGPALNGTVIVAP